MQQVIGVATFGRLRVAVWRCCVCTEALRFRGAKFVWALVCHIGGGGTLMCPDRLVDAWVVAMLPASCFDKFPLVTQPMRGVPGRGEAIGPGRPHGVAKRLGGGILAIQTSRGGPTTN